MYNLKDDPTTTQPSTHEIEALLEEIDLPKLTQEQLNTLNAPFTTQEILTIIAALPANKSPGPYGLMGEYYKRFTNILSPFLSKVCNDAASSSSLPQEMLNAFIITLPIPGKDPTSPQNFQAHITAQP